MDPRDPRTNPTFTSPHRRDDSDTSNAELDGSLSSSSDVSTDTSGIPVTSSAETTAPEVMTSEPPVLELNGAPMVFAPTPSSFEVSVAIASGDPSKMSLMLRASGSDGWSQPLTSQIRAVDLVEWSVEDLEPNSAYEYQLVALDGEDAGAARILFSGKARTARPPGESFKFAMVTDTHIGADLSYSNQGDELVYAAICAEIEQDDPDFLINLGDLLDYHQFGFNVPPPTAELSRAAYLNYRNAMGNLPGKVAHFGVVGNWDGENGEVYDGRDHAFARHAHVVRAKPEPESMELDAERADPWIEFPWPVAVRRQFASSFGSSMNE